MVITPEVARALTELSHSIKRQVGLLVNRARLMPSLLEMNVKSFCRTCRTIAWAENASGGFDAFIPILKTSL